jgi:hypothetical protein
MTKCQIMSKGWSKRLDERLICLTQRLPPFPLWLMAAMLLTSWLLLLCSLIREWI